jgi:hypothetical protein
MKEKSRSVWAPHSRGYGETMCGATRDGPHVSDGTSRVAFSLVN